MTGAGILASTTPLRWVIQAITIRYDQQKNRTPATPEVVYRAVRAGLEKAEVYRIPAVATYLMGLKPHYRTAPEDQMAEALFRAMLDHAMIATSTHHLRICEDDPSRLDLADQTLRWIAKQRATATTAIN